MLLLAVAGIEVETREAELDPTAVEAVVPQAGDVATLLAELEGEPRVDQRTFHHTNEGQQVQNLYSGNVIENLYSPEYVEA